MCIDCQCDVGASRERERERDGAAAGHIGASRHKFGTMCLDGYGEICNTLV